MKKDHREGTVGPWAKQKLDALQAYLNAYMNVMKNQRFDLVYVDAFAGTGVARVRRAEAQDDTFDSLLDDEDAREADEFIMGSPLRALGLSRQFKHYFFIDRDPRRIAMLEKLKGTYPGVDIRPKEGDANEAVQEIAAHFGRWNLRGVAFLDPYGAHLHWATLEALAATKKFDVIINFPLDMAINRLLKRAGDLPITWRQQLDLCFGGQEWHPAVYEVTDGLFGEKVVKREDARERLLDLYVDKLRSAFGHVAGPSLVRNTRGAPLYHLIWASSHARGQPIAKHILKFGEATRGRR